MTSTDAMTTKRIGILVVAYNVASTLAQTLDRIPSEFRPRISEVLVCDNASEDSTYLVGLGYKQLADGFPLTVIRQPRNLGYGGNQKAGYQWAIENDLDIVVLLHGDGQYAPEFLPQVVAPLERDECDAVFGSRMMEPGGARRGGMPLYKFVGNRVLTRFENAVVGTELSEWHSGYRAFKVDALRDIPFLRNSDEYDFDSEIIIELHEAGKRIVELPIPTYYGDEVSYVNSFRYAKDIVLDVLRYRAHKMGLGSGATAFAGDAFSLTQRMDTSHGRIQAWLSARRPCRILDLGCGDGEFGMTLRAQGHEVTGIDNEEHPGVRDRLHRFIRADLDDGVPAEAGTGFDVVLGAEVLAYVRRPDFLLDNARACLRPGGSLVITVPNFGHWYPRLRVLFGRFDYDQRGILDRGHMRFFTRRSFEGLASAQGFKTRRREALGLPLEVLERGLPARRDSVERSVHYAQQFDNVGLTIRPTLFAYQFVYELEPVRSLD
jgi:glycosyltransferase involved in cell wall biosynthesis